MESNDKLEQQLRQMYAEESLHEEDIDTSSIVDEEWARFEAEHVDVEASGKRSDGRSLRLSLLKIAAMFVGVLMLSGIAYAAVHILRSQETGDRSQETTAIANTRPATVNAPLAESDSTTMQSVVFEDAELATILNEIATFYQVELVYKKEASKHIRLYFTWDKKKTIDDVIETFNKFERFHIIRENKKLIVE